MTIIARNMIPALAVVAATLGFASAASADCGDLPGHDALAKALAESVKPSGGPGNGGLDLNMWATIVDVDGTVCAVAFTGKAFTDQWLGSRVISAQKANTANAFSLDGLALSTANLYAPTQPGGSLFGLQESNPVDVSAAYAGAADQFGTGGDPMVGKRIGGVNVFGGGLALYAGQSSAPSASREIRPAPITTSPGGCGAPLDWTRCRAASARTGMTASSTTSPARPAKAASAIRPAAAGRARSPPRSAPERSSSNSARSLRARIVPGRGGFRPAYGMRQ